MSFFSEQQVAHQRENLSPKCGVCKLYRTCESPKMAPYVARMPLGVLIVGEAPGRSEDEQGKPFVGKSGQFLRDCLAEIGVHPRDVHMTNALICHPPNSATPTAAQIDYCHPNLVRTIEELKPKVVITLGHAALKNVLLDYWDSVEQLERWVGWRIPTQRHWLCPTYHPSYLIRAKNDMLNNVFIKHLEEAFKIEHAPPAHPDWGSRVELLYDESKIGAAIEEMERNEGWTAFDYETTCLKPEYPKARIVSCSLSQRKRTISFPFLPEIERPLSRLLLNRRVRKIASNLKFEERWTRKMLGHGVRNWGWDTMLAAHCLDNRPGICSIKFQAFVQLGVPIYNGAIAAFLESYHGGHYNRVTQVDLPRLLLYGGLDSLFERRVAMQQRKEMGYED